MMRRVRNIMLTVENNKSKTDETFWSWFMNSFNRSEPLNTYSILVITNEIASAIFMLIYCPTSLSVSRDFLKSSLYPLLFITLIPPLYLTLCSACNTHHPTWITFRRVTATHLENSWFFPPSSSSLRSPQLLTILFPPPPSETLFIFGKMIFIYNSGIFFKKEKHVFLIWLFT